MQKQDFIDNNPLRAMIPSESEQKAGSVSLVMARAGVGKTAILVQIALDKMLRGKNILHVSIGQTLDKTKVWYDDIFRLITEGKELENLASIREDMIRSRMIMTFNAETFNVSKLEERLRDIVDQHIFRPDTVLIDGFDCAKTDPQELGEMQKLMTTMGMNAWVSARSHRDDERVSASGVPAPCHELDAVFEMVIVLEPKPEEKSIALNVVKDASASGGPGKVLNLDPATMMLKA